MQTDLKHSFDLFGIECDKGWESLYLPIINYVNDYNNSHTDSCIYITQIKEKFAGLRIYWNGENVPKEICDELQDMISTAEERSYKVCEKCGATKNVGLVTGSWYFTLCEDCAREMINKKDWLPKERIWKCNDDGKTYKITTDGKYEYKKD